MDAHAVAPPHAAASLVQPWKSLAFLLPVCFVTLFCGAGTLPLLGPDEPRYAEIAREMWATGDYISPRLCGKLWLEKPALLYWLQALAYHIGGPTEWAARLPSGIGAFLLIVGLIVLVWRFINAEAGLAAGVVTTTCVGFIAFSHAATTDMLLTVTMGGALAALYASGRMEGRVRWRLYVVGMALVGASLLAKGLVGPLLIALIFGMHWVWARSRIRFEPTLWLVGTFVLVAVAASWYGPMFARHGRVFFDEFIVRQHFARFSSNLYNHPQPFYYYGFIVLVGMLPWTLWLLPAARELRSLRPRTNEADSLRAFAWMWALVPILFFSASQSKLPGYVLPAFPALAILAGDQLSRGVWLPRRMAPRRALMSGAGLVVVLALFSLGVVWPRIGKKGRSAKAIAINAALQLRPGERTAFFRMPRNYTPVFYTQGRVVAGQGSNDIYTAYTYAQVMPLLRAGSVILFLEKPDVPDLQRGPFHATFLGGDRIQAWRVSR